MGEQDTYGRMSFSNWGADYEQVGRQFFQGCGADAFCSGYLGTQPFERVVALYDKLKTGHCSLLTGIGFDETQLKAVTGQLLSSSVARVLLPAFIYRLDRCDKHDRGFVLTVLSLFGLGSGGASGYSPDEPADMNQLLYRKFSDALPPH